jgi:Ca2+-binding EF-hand superfamily protein
MHDLNIRGGEATTAASNEATPTAPLSAGCGRLARMKMWETCFLAVLSWISIGTIFYSRINGWPLATAFFYAVDAGMSIGFCTEVAETTDRSRAFSVLFILLGASVVGGALALFVADLLEGVARTITFEYRSLIENDAFERNDRDKDDHLAFSDIEAILKEAGYHFLTREQIDHICRGMDKTGDQKINRREFSGFFRKVDLFLSGADTFKRKKWVHRLLPDSSSVEEGKYFMYVIFLSWMSMGIAWGMYNQGWTVTKATHFAVSALATGGLTAPPVNENGVLPTGVAIFVGIFSLLGVPLFYLAMGHSAKLLIQGHLAKVEERIIRTPLKPYEYLIGSHLTSPENDAIYLSDFIVLQFLRRGLTDINTIQMMRKQFEVLDSNGDGSLDFGEATRSVESVQEQSNSNRVDAGMMDAGIGLRVASHPRSDSMWSDVVRKGQP